MQPFFGRMLETSLASRWCGEPPFWKETRPFGWSSNEAGGPFSARRGGSQGFGPKTAKMPIFTLFRRRPGMFRAWQKRFAFFESSIAVGSQAPPSFWEVAGLPQKVPELSRKFSATSPEALSLWNLTAIQRFPGSSPNFPGSSLNFPGSSGTSPEVSPFLWEAWHPLLTHKNFLWVCLDHNRWFRRQAWPLKTLHNFSVVVFFCLVSTVSPFMFVFTEVNLHAQLRWFLNQPLRNPQCSRFRAKNETQK